jgi:hypothetical protein
MTGPERDAERAADAAAFAEAMRLADMLAERADGMAAGGWHVLAGHLRADARHVRAEAWRTVGYA